MKVTDLPPDILATCFERAAGEDFDRLCKTGTAFPAFRHALRQVDAFFCGLVQLDTEESG